MKKILTPIQIEQINEAKTIGLTLPKIAEVMSIDIEILNGLVETGDISTLPSEEGPPEYRAMATAVKNFAEFIDSDLYSNILHCEMVRDQYFVLQKKFEQEITLSAWEFEFRLKDHICDFA